MKELVGLRIRKLWVEQMGCIKVCLECPGSDGPRVAERR